MDDRYGWFDELALPFIFVPYGEPEPPELAAFKAEHPDWVAIPATFLPYEEADERGGTLPPQVGYTGAERLETAVQEPPRRRMQSLDMAAAVRAFQRANASRADPVAALRALRDVPDAFGDAAPTQSRLTSSALATSGPYVSPDPGQWIGKPPIGSGECVALIEEATGSPHSSRWHRGAAVKGNFALRPGTAIATFDDNGKYGNHTDGRSHAAIYLGQDAHGIRVIDRWRGHRPTERIIRFDDKRPAVNNGNRFSVIE